MDAKIHFHFMPVHNKSDFVRDHDFYFEVVATDMPSLS
jgi:hypothetical protein